jgi:hypothetical protein
MSSGADQSSRDMIEVAVQIWGKKLKGKTLLIFCDNEASVTVINSGSTKDSFMQNCLRELCFVEATHEFEVRAKHIAGEENHLAQMSSGADQSSRDMIKIPL